MQTLWQDLRYGARMLFKQPGFTLIAVVTLALGIGANAAMFSVVNSVLLRPLPFHEPERLAMIWEDASSIGFAQDTPAPGNYADWKAQTQTFAELAARDNRSFNLTGDGEPEKLHAYGVTANLFPMLGVAPALGRNFSAQEDQPDAPKLVIISHNLWQNRYGADPAILNRTLLLNDEPYTVIGVMPADFSLGESYVKAWVPAAFTAEELANRRNHYLNVFGRLKPGVTLAQANADIQTITKRIAERFPADAAKLEASVKGLHEQVVGQTGPMLWLLLGAVTFVLLIACANIAGLLLSRATTRQKEMAVRAALGASRWALVRQLLTEGVLLASLGGALGLLLASWTFALLKQLLPPTPQREALLQMDARVLLFAFAVSLLAGVLFSLLPAWQAAQVNLTKTLKQGGSTGASHPEQRRWLSVFVIGELALALVLVVGAGLLIQTLYRLHSQYFPLQAESVLTLRTDLPQKKYEEHAKRTAFYDQVLERVQALPGVVSAGYSTSVPLAWAGGSNGITLEGRTPETGVTWNANHRQVSAAYLQTMRIALREGRYLTAQDTEQTQPVVTINETMARQYWPNESAIGKRFKNGRAESKNPWLTVVGVVADVRQVDVDKPVKAEMYLPYRQIKTHTFFAPRDLVVRTTVEPNSLIPAIRTAIHAVDPTQPLSSISTLNALLDEFTQMRRAGMWLLTAFAGLALLLALLGIYGVLSYFVTQHAQEIGVRLALGASSRDVFALVLKRGLTLAVTGVAIGLIAALALARLLRGFLFEVSAADPLTYAAVALLLLVVATLACALPARRATKVDPMIALRCE